MVRATTAHTDDGLPVKCGYEYEYSCVSLTLGGFCMNPIIWHDLVCGGAAAVV